MVNNVSNSSSGCGMGSRMKVLEERVNGYLNRMGVEPRRSPDGLYLFKYGSTVVMMSLLEDEYGTYVRCASTLLKDFNMTSDLAARLLRLNAEVRFGAFLLFDDNTLSFAATILGDNLDYEELRQTLEYVAKTSDDYDDVLQQEIGGKKASDILQEAENFS